MARQVTLRDFPLLEFEKWLYKEKEFVEILHEKTYKKLAQRDVASLAREKGDKMINPCFEKGLNSKAFNKVHLMNEGFFPVRNCLFFACSLISSCRGRFFRSFLMSSMVVLVLCLTLTSCGPKQTDSAKEQSMSQVKEQERLKQIRAQEEAARNARIAAIQARTRELQAKLASLPQNSTPKSSSYYRDMIKKFADEALLEEQRQASQVTEAGSEGSAPSGSAQEASTIPLVQGKAGEGTEKDQVLDSELTQSSAQPQGNLIEEDEQREQRCRVDAAQAAIGMGRKWREIIAGPFARRCAAEQREYLQRERDKRVDLNDEIEIQRIEVKLKAIAKKWGQ